MTKIHHQQQILTQALDDACDAFTKSFGVTDYEDDNYIDSDLSKLIDIGDAVANSALPLVPKIKAWFKDDTTNFIDLVEGIANAVCVEVFTLNNGETSAVVVAAAKLEASKIA